jgi:hypothetical protein
MLQYVLKVAVTSLIVVAVAELGKRSSFMGAVLASLPVVSMLSFIWLYTDTSSTERVAALSTSIFWLVLPSLVLFVVLPVMLRAGMPFWVSLVSACAATVVAYIGMVWLLGRFNVSV